MSVEALALVLHHSKAIGTTKLVLLGIANHQGDGGSWPAIATLARYANVDPRTVQRSIGTLAEMGELQVVQRPGKSTFYRVLVTCPQECDRSMGHRLTPDTGVTPDVDVTPDTGVTPTPDAGVTPDAHVTPDAGVANPRRQRRPTPDAGVTRTINEPEENHQTTTSSGDARRGTRIPDDFMPTPEMKQWAFHNAPGTTIRDHDQFLDYWRSVPGARGRKVDWEATWRNWMRKESEQRQRPTVARTNPNSADNRMARAREIAARLAAEDAQRLELEQSPIADLIAFPSVGEM